MSLFKVSKFICVLFILSIIGSSLMIYGLVIHEVKLDSFIVFHIFLIIVFIIIIAIDSHFCKYIIAIEFEEDKVVLITSRNRIIVNIKDCFKIREDSRMFVFEFKGRKRLSCPKKGGFIKKHITDYSIINKDNFHYSIFIKD
jgi:hypothetical protein